MHEKIENCVSFQTFCIHRHDYVCFSKSSRFSTSSNNRLFECCCEDVGYKTYCITFFSKMNKVLTTELLLILLLSFFFSSHFLSSFLFYLQTTSCGYFREGLYPLIKRVYTMPIAPRHHFEP